MSSRIQEFQKPEYSRSQEFQMTKLQKSKIRKSKFSEDRVREHQSSIKIEYIPEHYFRKLSKYAPERGVNN